MRMKAPAAVGALLGIAVGGAYLVAQSATTHDRVIKVTARKFAYDPPEITVRKGEPVTLEFRTADVFMGFNLPDFKARADIVPGMTTRLHLMADRTGSFVFLCDVFCGIGHEEMSGKLTVVE